MHKKIAIYFPENKIQWLKFLKLSLPILGASMLFALNSFVDNFMVGHIKGATSGLFAVNSWTGIIMGIFVGTSSAGSIFVAQYYFSGNYDKVREIAKIRYLLTFSVSLIFSILSWVEPKLMVGVFLSKPSSSDLVGMTLYNDALKQGIQYIKYIAFMWLLISLNFNIGNMLRETGHGKFIFWVNVASLLINILLNFLTMHTGFFGYTMESEGAAIATIFARITSFVPLVFVVFYKKIPIFFNIFKIFKISIEVQKSFWSRSLVFFFTSAVMFFITFRNKFYVLGYPSGSIKFQDIGIGASDFLGLTGAIFGIFAVIFNAINILVAISVGGELGKNNIEEAKETSKRIHGFILVVSIIFSITGLIISFLIPYMHFLQNTASKISPDHPDLFKAALKHDKFVLYNTKLSMIVLMVYLPWWNWFMTSKSCLLSGGRVNLVSSIDLITSGPMFLGWLALVMLVIGPTFHLPFWCSYAIAYLADIPRGICFIALYYKRKWAFNITSRKSLIEEKAAFDVIDDERVIK